MADPTPEEIAEMRKRVEEAVAKERQKEDKANEN